MERGGSRESDIKGNPRILTHLDMWGGSSGMLG